MIWIAVGLGLVLVLFIVMFNRMVAMRRLTENAWSDVDVYLKRRAELVPNLVEAVKGAAQYERTTFEQLTAARSQSLALAGPTSEKAAAENQVSAGLGRAVAVAEAYPELRTSENFLGLQRDLSENERLIASARQYYNACVRDYNTMIESFPQNLMAGPFGFREMSFFEIENLGDRIAPKVGMGQ